MAEKIIFLDFDGVLNSLRSYAAYGDATFCRTSVDLILTLLKQTGAKIVISSSWRESFSLKQHGSCDPTVPVVQQRDQWLTGL